MQKWGLLLLIGFFSFDTWAQDFKKQFEFSVGPQDRGVAVNWSFPDAFALQVFNALEGLRQMPELQPAQIESHFVSLSPFEFFSERVEKIHLNTEPKVSECAPGVVAYVRNSTSQTLYLCPYAQSLTTLALQSNLLHEARHLDGPEYTPGEFSPQHPDRETAYPHVLCQRGDFEDYEACDEQLESGGSYAVQTEFFLKVAATPSIPAPVRQEARGMAAIYLLDHFNQAPFELVQGAVLLSDDGRLFFFDGTDTSPVEMMADIPKSSIVALRTFPTILNPADRSVKSYVTAETFMETPGAFSQKFRQFSPSQNSRLLDVYYGGMQACFLFTDAVYCEVGSRSVNLPLPKEWRPVHFNILSLFGGDMVSIVSEQGDFYSVPLKKEVGEWAQSPLEKLVTLSGFRSVAMMPGAFNAALTLDGKLVTFQKITEPQIVEAVKNRRFTKILSPFLWSPGFEDL